MDVQDLLLTAGRASLVYCFVLLVIRVERLGASRQGISDAHGERAEKGDNTATAEVKVKLGDRRKETLEFPLVKEHGLWRLSSIDPLRRLADR